MILFSKAIECTKYFENKYDIDCAKNLQGLSLIHAEKGEYEISKPLIKEACSIVVKYLYWYAETLEKLQSITAKSDCQRPK
jgi:hypothetical protein